MNEKEITLFNEIDYEHLDDLPLFEHIEWNSTAKEELAALLNELTNPLHREL